MRCSTCGAENRAGRKFCAECGTVLANACPTCGAANQPGEKFCGECGASLVPEPGRAPAASASPTSAAAASERRLVSVLFADLVGFTSLSEERDAEEVRELLSRYFDTSRRLIGLYGGTVEKFIGDAVMAVWGTPTAQEDDAERAVRAALDLTQGVRTLGQEVGAPELRARAGVLTGEAAVTVGAEGQGMVAGDLVNTASRIQSVAAPGSVLVGESTRRATEAAIAYEDAGEHAMKGKAEPVHLWRAARVVAGVRGALKSAGFEAPFVGRDRELRLIKELFHSSADQGRAHLFSVVGIAGIGKSRLAWEFEKYIDGLADTISWHRGRCLAYGEGVTYWALAEMVRMRARIIEGEEASSAQAKLRAMLEERVPDAEERRWIEPPLAHLLGLEERSARGREDLFAAWRLFFERLADARPTVMVFEDVQWADASLLDFVEYLLDWSRHHRLFVVTLARPEFTERRHDWGAGKRSATSVHLEPLSAEAMSDLLSGLVPGLPDELSEGILDRAAGVPLYAVETVRMLLDRGLVVQEGTWYRPAGPVGALEVPETLHALIAARLDGLAPEDRRLIQDAAVLGKTFTKAGVASLSALPEEQLDQSLTSLIRKEILSVQADPRSPERGQYGFLQDLMRKVAYDTLSRKERKARHLAAASYLERSWGSEEEEIVEVVASHYVEAFRAAPDAPDAAEIRTKAREALIEAGERAASLAANEEAGRYYEQAIELADDPVTEAELHGRAGEVAWRAGRAEHAARHLQRSLELFESEGRVHPAARVSATYAEVLWSEEASLDEALDRMERAFEVLSQEEPDEDLATIAAQLGRFLLFSGRNEEAWHRIEHALRLAEGLQLPEVFSQALNTKSLLLSVEGRREEARVLLEHALHVALENDLGGAALRAYNNLCAVNGGANRSDEELRAAEQGVELARRLGDHRWEVQLLACHINPLVASGRWDEALARLAEVQRAAGSAGATLASELAALIPVYINRGDIAAARERLAILAPLEGSTDLQARVTRSTVLGMVLAAEGENREALAVLEDALGVLREMGPALTSVVDLIPAYLEVASSLGEEERVEQVLSDLEGEPPGTPAPSLLAHAARHRARATSRAGRVDGVEPGFERAAAIFRSLKAPFWLAVTLAEHGEWLVGEGRPADAEPLLTEARGIFEGLGAAPWLERVDRVAGLVAGATALGGAGG